MGRLEHLKRQALGRSAYLPLEQQAQETAEALQAQQTWRQLYDRKGRPTNPPKERLAADLRNAQNEVLTAVGVLQRQHIIAARIEDINARSKHELYIDYSHAKSFAIATNLIASLIIYYPQTLLMRCLADVYARDVSLTSIVATDLGTLGTGSLPSILQTLLPGLPLHMIYSSASTCMDALIEHLLGSLRASTSQGHDRQAARQFYTRLTCLVLQASAQLCLLPILQSAICTQLGIANHSSLNHSLIQQYALMGRCLHGLARFDLSILQGFLMMCLLPTLTGGHWFGPLGLGPAVQQQNYQSTYPLVRRLHFSVFAASLGIRPIFHALNYCTDTLEGARNRVLSWYGCIVPAPALSEHNSAEGGADLHRDVSQVDRAGSCKASNLNRKRDILNGQPLARLLHSTDAILLRITQLPLDFWLLHSARTILGSGGQSAIWPLSHDSSKPRFPWRSSGMNVNSISRVGLALTLVMLGELSTYGITWLAVKARICYQNLHNRAGEAAKAGDAQTEAAST